MYYLRIVVNMFQTIYFTFVECCIGINSDIREYRTKKIKIMKDVNDGELVCGSSRVLLEANEWYSGKNIVNMVSTYIMKINPMNPRNNLYA